LWVPLFAALAFALLWSGHYRAIERVLVAMVVLMSVVFLATTFVLAPPLRELLAGAFIPRIPDDGRALLVALGLVGTTVVPYNLFLHAAAVRERWQHVDDLPAVRADLSVAIILGGVISMAIVVTAAAALREGGQVTSAAEMAAQLEPLLGPWARVFFAAGLFAAGMTSAITAPLAASYAVAGALGWPRDLRSTRLRAVWGAVLLAGVPFAIAGTRPTIPLGFGEVSVIVFAQIANGVLLPAVALFLLVAVNDRRRMGAHANGAFSNIVGTAVVLITGLIGATAIYRALS
jgi:Mn2+/Fe2+ NRAMP family transporter